MRRVDVRNKALAELGVLVGFDDDLAGEATRVANRIRGRLTQIHPVTVPGTTAEKMLPRLSDSLADVLRMSGGMLLWMSRGELKIL